MSGVFRRNRTETRLQFYVNALDLQVEITKFVMREKVMPKKWRHSQGYKLLDKLKELYIKYGIILNTKKTHITDLKHGFKFLKTRFYLTDSGKILRKPCRDVITRQRKRLKGQARLLKKGILTQEDIEHSYQSWCGSMIRRQARKTLHNMNQLYNKLFTKGE